MTWPNPVVHNNLRTFGADSTSTNLLSDYLTSARGFTNLRTLGADSTSTDLQQSGFDYLIGSSVTSIEVDFNEPIFITDLLQVSNPGGIDPAFITDILMTEIDIYFNELLFITDSLSSEKAVPETAFILDELTTQIDIYFNEFLFLSDIAAPFIEDIDTGTVVIEVFSSDTVTGTTVIEVTEDIIGLDTVNINIYEDNLVPVVNASSILNIFNPVVIINGQYVINPQSQIITDASLARCLVQYDCNAITGGLSNVLNWSLTINNEGGNFSVTTITPIGVRGETIEIFGLSGFITNDGEDVSNSSYGYTIEGIFGSPTLHKQLAFTLYGNTNYIDLIPNQYLVTPEVSKWQTCADACRAIADISGVQILWAANDAPLDDLFNETSSGMTALQALSSLATRVGANLRWNGGLFYTIAYPDISFGSFIVPDCCLIESLNFRNIYDLETGAGLGNLNAGSLGPGSAGVVLFPQLKQFVAGIKNLNDNLLNTSNNPSVHQFDKITKKLESDDPPIVYDLPANYQDVYVQILTKTSGIGKYVTTDQKEFFLLTDQGRIGYNDVGGLLIPQVVLDSSFFPIGNDDIDSNHFVCTVAATLRDLSGAYQSNVNKHNDDLMNLLRQTQESFRFIRNYSGTINCIFFGALPLTGMSGTGSISATINGITRTTTVNGIIESVSFNSPGVLSVSVAKYTRMDFLQQWKNFRV